MRVICRTKRITWNLKQPSICPSLQGFCQLVIVWGALAVILFLTPAVVEGGAILNAKYDYYHTTGDTTDKLTDNKNSARQTLKTQTYSLYLDRSLYPFVKLNVGGIFKHERDETEQGDFEQLRKEETLSPRAGIVIGNRPVSFGVEYNGLRRKRSLPDLETNKDIRDQVDAFVNWLPNDQWEFNLRISDQKLHNDPKTVDREEQIYSLRSRYTQDALLLEYNLNINEQDNLLVNSKTDQVNHSLRADYRRQYPAHKLDLLASYRGNTTHTDFSTKQRTEFELPVDAGLDSLDDSPQNGELNGNILLIDGNKTTSAGPDIGKSGNPTFFVNLGVDFGSDLTVSQLYVYVDRSDLPAQVTDSYIWSVYTSEDNTPVTVWTLHAVVAQASFNALQNRFEISFPAVSDRFIKVAVSPLSVSIPGPYDDIFVTEIEAWDDVDRGSFDYRTIFHSGSFALNKIISDQTRVSYDLYGNYNKSTLNDAEEKRLANAVRLNHQFTPVYSGTLRASLTNSWKSEDPDLNVFEYGASGQADFLETLNMSLDYSGIKASYDDGRDGGRDSLLYRTRAQVYRDADLDFSLGYSLIEELDGRKTGNTLVGFGAHLVPHPKFDFRLSTRWVGSDVIKEGTDPGAGATSSHYVDMDVIFTPTQRLSLLGKLNYRKTDGDSSSLKSFSINWNALADGELKLFLSYYEAYRTELSEVDKILTPGLLWRISQHLNLHLRYHFITSDSDVRKRDFETFNGTFNVTF